MGKFLNIQNMAMQKSRRHLLQASTREVWVTKVLSMDFSIKFRAR
jgi:hypothetical protein